ncbi:MAG: sorbosone dehydrogenase family protein [Paucimonas sp.]|nr:sorbosone dehydrogenase family protein [Paucimonas sp.]
MKRRTLMTGLLLFAAIAGCAEMARLPLEAGMGPRPTLPPPPRSALPSMPTVHIAPATGWPQGAAPRPAPGFRVQAFATGLAHPRSLLVLPNGDVLVAETDAPPRPDDEKGVKGWISKQIMQKAGSHRRSPNRIALLRDADGDGIAETRSVLLSDLNSPFGMALIGNHLYVANTDAVLRFPYRSGDTSIAAPGVMLAPLPAGKLNHHWTKDLVASRDGKRLYASVGSNSNIVENGLENEVNRAAILEIDVASGATRLYASGLRNPNGLGWNPVTGELWAAVNERDELGSDLVPDYITSVRAGGFYGWPWSYYGQHVDERVKPARPDMVAKAIVPDYAVGAHTAPLGMAFYTGKLFAPAFQGGAFVGQHGSWNRKPRSGYKVIFVPFRDGRPDGMPRDVLDGFVDADGNAMGRPVGVALDKQGGVLVADDVGGAVWRVIPG